MSETKHTPGPWILEGPWAGFCNIRRADNGEMVMSLSAPGPEFGDREHSPEEKEANANLMAAAPELLDACKAMFKQFKIMTTDGDGLDALGKAYEAIEKAEGL